MGELAVRFKVKRGAADALAETMRFSFPFWGIVAPMAAILCGLYWIASAVFGASPPGLLTLCLIGLAVPLIGLRISHYLEKDFLLADKSGIELPTAASYGFSSKHVPWNLIDKIEVAGDCGKLESARLVFYMRDDEPSVLPCSSINSGELEQLLLACQLWAPAPALDVDLARLQETVKNVPLLAGSGESSSYTALWEEELRRRFRQVAFLPLEPGRSIRNGSLKVVRQLAMGGLSAIYLCQLDGRDFVVIKEAVVPDDSPDELKSKAAELFDREARLLMKLEHDSIVKVLDYFVEGGRSYMMLEYVTGQDLRQYVKQNGRLRETVAVDWATQIASAMQYLHRQTPPVIHRDLTPDNLVVRNDGSVVVIDFGAANEFIGNSTGTFVGKQCYIAPEQFRGKATPQSDIYAFGGTLYFLLTGQDPEALSSAHPAAVNASVSKELDALVSECSAPECDRRIATADLVVERLRALSSTASAPAAG